MASRTGERTLRFAGGWARVGPWRDRPDVAHLVLATETILARGAVDDCLTRVIAAGYSSVVTSPLTEAAVAPFLEAGFSVREWLHLLSHSLDALARFDPDGPALRRAWRADRREVVELDARAFEPSWRLGPTGLREALRATPAVRFRVGHRDQVTTAVAYAVTGRAGWQGYLQRLAVDPGVRGHGFGRALVEDALRWLHRGGGRRCLVNTQEDNQDALRLYASCGFRRLPAGLAVLGSDL